MFYVYILRCNDNTLYTGFTVDLERRIKTHNKGMGAKYTRGRLPVELVYKEEYKTKSEALKREYTLKKLNRIQKLKIIKGEKA
ncbi:GIY-YIG nuclease family protein [Tissierella creatinophila]|uniref:GIY-YIG nuclease superfamily protein n=1 Tax=Tissierella creatinophila DSM 6911 TaxID=1123403 RepID=A0A1U7M5P4_TISCR|nr:GIY-YIG nuclease family protein [Tissierella creatinophila]OLS02539.1 GIY-YIG nuclease superfamily protein [Tissierella creatinophila DSM 6911]